MFSIIITTERGHEGKHSCIANHIDVSRLVGQNSKQLSHSTQYTHCSKSYHVMTSCMYIYTLIKVDVANL